MTSKLLAVIVVILIVALVVLNLGFFGGFKKETPDFFVGISAAYADVNLIKASIDEVSTYTNVFVIGSTGISADADKLNEVCQHLVDKSMYFIIYSNIHYDLDIIYDAAKKFSNNFLGLYFGDEPGGKTLDKFEFRWVNEADNISDAADQFVYHLHYFLNSKEINGVVTNHAPAEFTLFSADYALYWFDYLASYDTIFAEFGWNYSRQINVALNRGAATVRDRDWGIIITWTFNNPPYIESGEQLYQDLIFAYDNGAKYILVFDSNEDYTGGILQEEHFDALKQFWEYVKNNPRGSDSEKHVAFVLPDGYGYGFRGPDDKIWGLWEADWLSLEVSYHIGSLLDQYGNRLDIIYDDSRFNFREYYSEIIFWNGTNYDPPKVEPPENDMLPVFVEDVSDGDTFQTTEGYKIRLADIDAPELGGIGYSDSREFLELLIEHKIVILDIDEKIGSDLYGRYDCVVYLPYNSTHYINVNQASVEGGYSIIHNYSNEFDPTVWSLYSPINSIPEFQLFLIFPLFLMVTLFVIILKSQI
ncbi:MAG: thermonuclease family protein [Candidatus Bathyarchaeota archaeon]